MPGGLVKVAVAELALDAADYLSHSLRAGASPSGWGMATDHRSITGRRPSITGTSAEEAPGNAARNTAPEPVGGRCTPARIPRAGSPDAAVSATAAGGDGRSGARFVHRRPTQPANARRARRGRWGTHAFGLRVRSPDNWPSRRKRQHEQRLGLGRAELGEPDDVAAQHVLDGGCRHVADL